MAGLSQYLNDPRQFAVATGPIRSSSVVRRLLVFPIVLLFALSLSGCLDDEAPDYRYRLTVEVETPEELRSGSSVIQVRQTLKVMDSKPVGVRRRAFGEAVAIDLPDGSTLFALLRGEGVTSWPETIMGRLAPEVEGEPYVEKLDDMLALSGEIELPRTFPARGPYEERSAYPMLVRFEDIDDPTSVTLVDPDDLAATFGEGYALKRITVQITDDPVTRGIEKRLPSFGPETGFDEWYKDQPWGDPLRISKDDFKRE